MPRARSAGSDSDVDQEGISEQEHIKLTRQFRIMEGDRSAYTEETHNIIRKQKEEISHLELEKQDLLKELRLAESRSNQMRDDDHTETLGTLAEAQGEYNKEIEMEKQKAAELDAKIRDWERKMNKQHRNMGGVHMSSQHTVQTQKTMRTLENRLDQAKRRFNTLLTENARGRDEIECLRVERQRFDALYKKLDKELTSLRRQKGQVIENSTVAYDLRDECQQKNLILKEKADKDLQQHNSEMKELLRIVDNERYLKQFMGIKGQERQEDPQLVIWRKRKALKIKKIDDYDVRLISYIKNGKKLQEKALETERKKESQEDSVEIFAAAFERIKQLTGLVDLDELVKRFIEVEDKNFALFNYVNEQNNDIEELNDEISEVKNEIAMFSLQGIEIEDQRKKILKELEDKQTLASKEGDEYEKIYTEISKIIDQLRRGIESLFNKINCDRSAIDDMLGAAKGVTDGNMIQYLGIIEQRTNELLAIQNYVSLKDMDRYEKCQSLIGEGPPAPQPILPIVPPNVGEESDGSEQSEDDTRPLTRNELQKKVMKTVKKRESAARKEGFRYDLTTTNVKTKGKKDKK